MININIFNQATDLSTGTIKAYKDKASILNRKIKENNIKISQHRRVINFIIREYPNPSTQNVYFSMMINYFKFTGKTHLKIYQQYKDLVMKNGEIREQQGKIKKCEKLSDLSSINFKEGIEKFNQYVNDNEKFTQEDLILAFYILQSPNRNDYWDMRFRDNDDKSLNDDLNYLFKKGDEFTLLIRSKKKGKVDITKTIKNKNLIKIITSFGFKNRETIYKKSIKSIYSDLLKESKKYFGKGLTINDFRKLYTLEHKESMDKILESCKEMGHTIQTKIKYYM